MATLYHVCNSPIEDESMSLRYVGIRNISDTEKIKEEDIVDKEGSVIGVKNRVRAGLQHFEGHVQEVISWSTVSNTTAPPVFCRDKKRRVKLWYTQPASRRLGDDLSSANASYRCYEIIGSRWMKETF